MIAKCIVMMNDKYSSEIYFGADLGGEIPRGWYANIFYFETDHRGRESFVSMGEWVGPFDKQGLALAAIEGAISGGIRGLSSDSRFQGIV